MALIYSNIIEFTQAARIYSSNFTFWIFSTSKKIFNSCNMYIFLISAATPAATPATCYHQCLCAIDRSPTKGMQQGWEQQWFSMSWVWQEIYVWKKSQRAERVDSWKAEKNRRPSCPRKFYTLSKYKAHLLTHSGEKSHHFDRCGIKFSQSIIWPSTFARTPKNGGKSVRNAKNICTRSKDNLVIWEHTQGTHVISVRSVEKLPLLCQT